MSKTCELTGRLHQITTSINISFDFALENDQGVIALNAELPGR